MKLTNRGFTLVELMIVIAIIGILAAALFPSMTSYLKRSRDAARTAHLKDISTAVGAFYADKERYPNADSGALNGCVNVAEITSNYMPKGIPTDPTSTNQNGCGNTAATAAGKYSYGNTSGVGVTPLYVLGALLENTSGGNTGTTHANTGWLYTSGAALSNSIAQGLVKGAGQAYVLTN